MGTLEQTILSNAVLATVLALVVAGIGSVCRRPAVVHSLWLLVLLKLITPPILPVEVFHVPSEKPTPPESASVAPPVDFGEPVEPPISDDSLAWIEDSPQVDPVLSFKEMEPAPEENPSPHSEMGRSFDWSHWANVMGLVWLTGSVIWLAVAGCRIAHFQRLLAHAQPAPKELQAQTQKLARRLGLARCPDIWLVPGTISPMIWPVGARSRLLVPAELLDRLSVEQRATLLVHELAHLRRGDHWVRGLELVVTGLYWWHPVVWWARREISEAEEQCCDAWVVWAFPQAARSYASALLETVDFLAGARPVLLPPAASGLGQFRLLKRRLHMIMSRNTPKAMSWAGFLAVVGLGLFLPVLPTWGQQAEDDDKRILKKEVIKKSVEDAIKQIDVDKIMKIKEDVIRQLDKDLKLDKDMLKKIQIDVIEKLNKDIDKIPEDVIKSLDDLIQSVDEKADPTRFKDLYRSKDQLKKALAQLIESRVQVDDPEQLSRQVEVEKAEALLGEARAQLQKAQEQVKQAQRRLLDMEKQVRQLHQARARENSEKANRVRHAREEEFKRTMEAVDKEKGKADSSRFEKRRDSRRSDDDLEQRFEKLLKEVQDLGRELKRRRGEERRKTTPKIEEEEESVK